MKEKFDRLCEIVRQDRYLESTMALLEWDQQTKLPGNAGEYRSEQITYLAGEIHKRHVASERSELINELSSNSWIENQTSDERSTVKELKRQLDKKSRLPQSLVEAQARASSVGQQIWVEARKENDFAKFAPILKEIFDLKREETEAIGYTDHPYDVLLDEYEPGAKTAHVAKALDELKTELVPLIQEIQSSGVNVDTSILNREFPIDQQEAFCRLASSQIGFDYGRGRLDVTHHPFCTEAGPEDVRITTRFDKNFFNMAFFGTLHEAGHGIYEQGLRSDQYGFAPGQYCSLGIHESQSRLWENQVGRSRSFWDYFYGPAQKHFDSLNDVDRDDFHAAINSVTPSLIRVESDEATYNLHIIIRFELEQELISGDLNSNDLTEAWNSKYREYLGVESKTDADGVLQDVHWSAGLVGYFPTYSLGNLYAAQLFDAAEAELGDLGKQFSRGEFLPLKVWLNENVHQKGQSIRADELVHEITGLDLGPAALIGQLRSKLAPIYRL